MGSGNTLKTAFLLAVFTALCVLAGGALGGRGGSAVAFGLAVGVNLGAYWFADRLVLKMARAKAVSHEEAPGLHWLVARLAKRARIPEPRLYVIDSPAPNAFATGRDPQHGALAVTSGIVQALDRDELAGVLAHEMVHIKNRDTLISALAAVAAGAITMLAGAAHWAVISAGKRRSPDDKNDLGTAGAVYGLLMLLLAPIAAALIRLAVSRTREYRADADGALILGDPLPLGRALEKLDLLNLAVPLEVSPSAGHQFTVQPFLGGGLAAMFNRHPPTPNRVARLRELALQPTHCCD